MRKVKWGVIGCGGIAKKRTIPGMLLADNCEVVAVQDVNEEVAVAVKEEFNVKYALTSVDELLALDEVEAVYIASPLFCHKEQVIKCAENKKHVLCEKPLGLNGEEVEEMISACKKADVKFGVAFMSRFQSHHVKIKEIIDTGVLGELVSIKAEWSFDYPEMNVWRQDIKLGGGGGFMDVGSHAIDILRFMTGLEAEEVVAITGNQFYNYSVEDTSQLLAKMTGGAVMYISSNYNMNSEPPRFEICGRKGCIVGDNTFSQTPFYSKAYIKMVGEEEQPITFEGEFANTYTAETAAFAQAIIDNTPAPVDAYEGLQAQRIIDAAYISANTGMRTKVKKD